MRKILIVIDMQKDFIDGTLGTKEAVAIVPAVVARSSPIRRRMFTRQGILIRRITWTRRRGDIFRSDTASEGRKDGNCAKKLLR